MSVRDKIAQNLHDIRLRSGHTVSSAARAIGIDRKNVYLYEEGVVMPRIDNLPRICKAYNVSPNEIMGWK